MYVIAYDIGTTGLKTCLYSIEDRVSLVAGTYQGYDLYILEGGGAEQGDGGCQCKQFLHDDLLVVGVS